MSQSGNEVMTLATLLSGGGFAGCGPFNFLFVVLLGRAMASAVKGEIEGLKSEI